MEEQWPLLREEQYIPQQPVAMLEYGPSLSSPVKPEISQLPEMGLLAKSMGSFAMSVDVVIDTRPRVYGPDDFADMPKFQAGMAALFDPVAAKANLDKLTAERERVMAENRANQVALLTGGTAERLEAKAQLAELDQDIAHAAQKHEVAKMAAKAESEVMANKSTTQILMPVEELSDTYLNSSHDFSKKETLSIEDDLSKRTQRSKIARAEIEDLREELEHVHARNAERVVELMHGDAADRIDASREVTQLKRKLAQAKGRLASVWSDYEISPAAERQRQSRIVASIGALAVGSVFEPPKDQFILSLGVV
jgi:hypothetical protein